MIICKSCKSQSGDFEGIIKYSISYEFAGSDTTKKDLNNYYGDKSIAYIKDGKYKQEYPNSRNVIEVIFDNNSNRYYLLFFGKDTLYYIDTRHSNLKYTLSKVQKPDTIILGHKCKSALLTSQIDAKMYYYTLDFPISARSFRNHKFGGYDILTRNIKSVYLSQITRFKFNTYKFNAYQIEKKPIGDSEFMLPKFPLEKYR
jgi:hypothetical protein